MPQITGGGVGRPKKPKKPKPPPATDTSVGGNTNAGKPIGPPTLGNIPKADQIGGQNNPSKYNKKGNVVPKASSSDAYKKNFTNEKSYTKGGTIKQAAAKRLGLNFKGASVRPGPKKSFKQAFELEKAGSAPTRKRRTGGKTIGGLPGGKTTGGFGEIDRDRFRGGPAKDPGGLPTSLRDRDLVGSRNEITEFDGTTYGSATDTEIVGGGGGGTGSSLFGREAVGRIGDLQGQSLEDVVFGVNRRGKKVRRARGE